MVLADDTDYLALDANWYARRLKQERPDEPWDEADIALRSELHALLAQFRKAEKEARDAKVPLASEALAALARAAEILQQLSESHPANAELPYDLACIAALQGKPDEAMAALTAAYEAGWWRGEMADADRDLASLRERDDYKALLQQMREVELESEPPAEFSARKQWNRAGEPAKVGRRYVISAMLAHVSEKTNTREEALTGLRASVAADGSRPTGTVYYMVSKDRARTGPRQWAFEAAAKALGELGVQAEVIDGVLPDSKLDVVGAMIGIAKFSWEESGSTILPGAFCDHLTSFGGVMTGTNQTLLSELMRHGAAGACGTVKEPYNTPTKFPTPFMHVFYASGCSLGEAFYQSVKAPYQQLLVGDPLCQPWATAPVVSVKGLQPGATVKGTRRLTATAEGDQPVARYELFVDGVRRQTCLPGERIVLDARELADGEHEARVVAIAGPVETQGRAIIPFRVRREN
ncbi:MAG TPA: hypothetical protein QGH10_06645, partial [Armatimonadota bacterium]|nr:hypothetical protein [Armatimonadota bacterium]